MIGGHFIPKINQCLLEWHWRIQGDLVLAQWSVCLLGLIALLHRVHQAAKKTSSSLGIFCQAETWKPTTAVRLVEPTDRPNSNQKRVPLNEKITSGTTYVVHRPRQIDQRPNVKMIVLILSIWKTSPNILSQWRRTAEGEILLINFPFDNLSPGKVSSPWKTTPSTRKRRRSWRRSSWQEEKRARASFRSLQNWTTWSTRIL